MRNIFIYFFIIVFIISFSCLQKYDNYIEISQIENLVTKRMEIINDFLYSEKDMLKLRIELSKIESDDLLMSDLELLTQIYNNPTDYEKIDSMVIDDVKEMNITDDNIEMFCKIIWKSFNGDEKAIATNFTKDYNIRCVKKDNDVFLTNLEVID